MSSAIGAVLVIIGSGTPNSSRAIRKIANPRVAAVFASYPQAIATKLRALRQLIFDVAAETEGVGELEETLKWGQPSYVTARTGSGSTIRIDQVKSQPGKYAVYFHCQTTLVDTFKEIYGRELSFVGNRCILLDTTAKLPVRSLRHCVSMALTYHLDKKRNRARP